MRLFYRAFLLRGLLHAVIRYNMPILVRRAHKVV